MSSMPSTHSWDYDGPPPRRENPYVRVDIDGEAIHIPLKADVYAHWHEQFIRSNPTDGYRKRYATLMNVIRAAYKEGIKEGLKRASGG